MAKNTNTVQSRKAAKNKNFKDERQRSSVDLSVSVIEDENPRNIWGVFDGDFTNPTPANLKYYLECIRKGFNFWAALFFTFITRRDLFLKAVIQTRKLPVTAKEWIIEEDETNKEAAAFFSDLFQNSTWFIQFIADCVEANISGLTIFEINYGIKDSKVIPESVTAIPNHLTLYHDQLKKYMFLDLANNSGHVLKTIGINQTEDRINFDLLKTIELDEAKMLEVHALDGTAGNGLLNGFYDGLIFSYLRKNYAKKDFAAVLEKWADPPVSASYENYLNDEGRRNAKRAVDAYGNAKKIVHSKDIEFKIHDEMQKAATTNMFMEYLNDEKEDISIAILGQTLTTKIDGGGSYAAANVHDRVRNDLQHADMIIVSGAVNELIRRLCAFNFPGIKPPVFKFISQVDTEFLKTLAVVIRDLRIAGFKPIAEELSTKFGFTLEETTPVGGAVDPNMEGADDTKADDDKKEPAEDDTKKPADEKKETLSMTLKELEVFAKEYNKKDQAGKIKLLLETIFEETKSGN